MMQVVHSGSMGEQKGCKSYMVNLAVHRARRGKSCQAVYPYGRLWVQGRAYRVRESPRLLDMDLGSKGSICRH